MIVPPDILTIDVEEWFHGHNYLERVPPETWDVQEERVVGNTELCLEMLERHGVKATFFVLGWTARRHPDLVRRIVRAGHEVGCHSDAHPILFELSADEFRRDTERALEALAAAGVDRVAGYRAPSFSLTPPVHGFLEILAELGFSYDCSIFPVRHPRYGQPASSRRPLAVDSPAGGRPLWAVPMTTVRLPGLNVPFSGGGYLRLLPLPAVRLLRKLARRQGQPFIVYFHPWELDTFRPDVGLDGLTRARSQGGQDSMVRKVDALLADGRWSTLGEFAADLERGD